MLRSGGRIVGGDRLLMSLRRRRLAWSIQDAAFHTKDQHTDNGDVFDAWLILDVAPGEPSENKRQAQRAQPHREALYVLCDKRMSFNERMRARLKLYLMEL